jgi:tripartite-type tricarboxylate transporter receptor subunit TctC
MRVGGSLFFAALFRPSESNDMKRSVISSLMRLPVAAVLAGALATSIPGGAAAQSFPSKPVRFILPFGAGGVADITARVVSQKLSDQLGQQVLVDNRPSAGGIIAAEAVAKAEPDGYTLFLVSNGTAVSAGLYKSLPFDPVKDFAPISTLGFFDIVVLVAPDSKFASVRDLIAFAKANPNKMSVGTISVGSTQNLAAELFRSMTGLDMVTVPYKATPDVVSALRSGQIQTAFEILAPVMGQVKSGAVKAIAVANERRFSGLPNVPTVSESGVPGYRAYSWNGMSAPAKTPRAIIDRLHREVAAAVAAPEVRQKLLGFGVDARSSSPEELQNLLVSEIKKWSAVIERAKIPKH